jgi:hypothetical protein
MDKDSYAHRSFGRQDEAPFLSFRAQREISSFSTQKALFWRDHTPQEKGNIPVEDEISRCARNDK